MTNEEAAKIIEGIEEVQGNLPEDGLLVEEALSTAIAVLRGDKPIGKWIKTTGNLWHGYTCDQCGKASDYRENFCPGCGADMRGGGSC